MSAPHCEKDLLVGADGVRSAVRAALVANHRDFDCAVSDSNTAHRDSTPGLAARAAAESLSDSRFAPHGPDQRFSPG